MSTRVNLLHSAVMSVLSMSSMQMHTIQINVFYDPYSIKYPTERVKLGDILCRVLGNPHWLILISNKSSG